MADATWRDVLAAELTEAGTGRLADRAVAALERDTPLLRDHADLRDIARSSAVANLVLIADIVARTVSLRDATPPPQSVAFARELARRNVPMSELARSYRVAQHEMWKVGVEQIRVRMTDPDAIAAAVEALTDATFATGEVLMGTALDSYATERDRWVRSADALRRETVEALLDGSPIDAAAASARLRYDLGREHVGFVVSGGTDEPAAPAVGGPNALLIPLAAGVTAGWCHPDALDLAAADDGAWVAAGTPAGGVDGFRSTHREAVEASRVASLAGLPGPTRYADVALTALLTKDLDQARAFASRELGGLAGDARLHETLLLALETRSPRRTAERLGVHENTVAKRIKSAEALLGHPIDQRPAELFAALLIARAVAR
jgi:DNA-binding CsgD family transcriptional regulator